MSFLELLQPHLPASLEGSLCPLSEFCFKNISKSGCGEILTQF